MAALSQSETRRMYSWWWDSHISPKNSKWLQENLTDMDSKVKSMIKLIEEDADSFARRAEMYYKKRPELMKLVEEFYRAYRALAERYNHAMGELHHAHRTIAKAFPDHVPFELVEDSPSKVWTPDRDLRMPMAEMKFPVRALFQGDEDSQGLSESDVDKVRPQQECSDKELKERCLIELHDANGDKEAVSSVEGTIRKGEKQENEKEESLREELLELSNTNQSLKDKILQETERAGKAEREVEGLKNALVNMQAEKEDAFYQYQQCLANLSNLEGELHNARRESVSLSEKSSRAEIEVQTLKEALIELEAEKDAGEAKQKEYLEKVSELEDKLYRLQEDTDGFNIRATKAEIEAQIVKDEISRLKVERDVVLHQYNQCLKKISALENVISAMENEARLFKSQVESAEREVSELKLSFANLNREKDALELQYKCCLETISKLEEDLFSAKRDVKRLNTDVLLGNLKLKNAEEKCTLLEMSNQSLRAEAGDLMRKIAIKDKELSEKQQELDNLQTSLQDEHLRHAQVEETLQTLQSLHSRSQDDQRALVLELHRVLQMLKDVEVSKHGLEEEIEQVSDENQSRIDMFSAVSVENKESDILNLRGIKERLEKEVSHHINVSNSLQQEIVCLKEEIKGLNKRYQAILHQIEAAGLKPECVGTSVKSLQDENLTLKEMYAKGCTEKEVLSKNLECLQKILEKKVAVESSMTDMSSELESSREQVKALQESFQSVHGEKAILVTEKACLLSQLQAMTESMHKLLEKNAILENSLSLAKVELEGLREKSKGLEDICELLKDERSYLLNERGNLALKLENVERRLEVLEKKYTGLEGKYADLVKEKEAVHCQVKDLEVSLGVEKQERMKCQLHSQTTLAGLESQLHVLREENKWKKKEYEEELDKSIKAQCELSVLQNIIEDMEEKNGSLIIECQKHVEASKLAEKLITELESESLEQQVEAEILLDEIERMRLSMYQVFRAIGTGPDCTSESRSDNEQIFVHRILESIQDMKRCISKHDDDKQLLLVENSVLLTLLEQLESKGMEIESKKLYLEIELKNMAQKLAVARNEKDKMLEVNREFKADSSAKQHDVTKLEAELQRIHIKQADLHRSYKSLEEAYLEVNQQNENLQKKISDLEKEKYQATQRTDTALLEYLATAVQSEAFRKFGDEKLSELNSLLSDLNGQHELNHCLEREARMLAEKLELQRAENVLLKDSVGRMERDMEGVREYNVQMKKDILNGKESLLQTEGKLLVAEIKLEAADNLNLKLCKTVNDLKNEIQESMQVSGDLENDVQQLSENSSIQLKEIERLQKVNKNLESDIGLLREEIEEKIIREQTLLSELQNKNREFELWEAEATAFYVGLQITSVHEVFFESKAQELTGLCWTLQNENASKTSEIELMKEKFCLMESEISMLKSHLYAYAPVIAALRDDIILLEHNALLQSKIKASHKEEPEKLEVAAGPNRSTSEIIMQDPSLVSLQNLQMRIKAVGKSMQEMNKPVLHRRANSSSKQEPASSEIERLKPLRCLGRDKQEQNRRKGHGSELSDTPKLQKIKTKSAELRNAMLTKDIPLDQASDSSQNGLRRRGSVRVDDKMLELWQTSPDSNKDLTIGESLRRSFKMTEKDIVYDQFENGNHKSDPPSTDSDVEKELGIDKLEVLTRSASRNREVNARRILERLSSDALKLENLQITVEDLRKKLEANKSRKPKNVDFETVEEQLLEAEETVVHLVDLNGQLVKTIEDCPSPDEKASVQLKEAARKRRRKVTEQARKGSERISRLQLELQKIQYILLKLEDEKKNRLRNKLFRSKTIVLRDFIYNGRKNSGKRKKGPFCGCFRPSTSRNGRSPSQ